MSGNTPPATFSSLPKRKAASNRVSLRQTLICIVVFLTGCVFSTTVILFSYPLDRENVNSALPPSFAQQYQQNSNNFDSSPKSASSLASSLASSSSSSSSPSSPSLTLNGKRILIAIASFDFSQFPLLEEVLDAYQDLCFAGASKVHIYIHTTVPYTVALIDLLNSRLSCDVLQVFIVIKTPALRLNLVDCHRTLFYEKIDEYDVFIYSEDDILIKPTTVATYLQETAKVQQLVSKSPAQDFNIGIVRYEYNYPPDVIINDKTRHATENVTRVYWEHLWKPLVPKSVHSPESYIHKEDESVISKHYVTMDNAHQGMFLATPELLRAWKSRPHCEFDVIRQRPGLKNKPSQPAEGTQRVWMSSRMLHGKKHCNVKQLIPINNFNQLTVWHLPNKNYRRVGKKGRIGGDENSVENEFGTGKENFIGPDSSLPTAMELHLKMREIFGYPGLDGGIKYSGIVMLNEVDLSRRFKGYSEHIAMVNSRMQAYEDYVKRGGQLMDQDYQNWKWTLERG